MGRACGCGILRAAPPCEGEKLRGACAPGLSGIMRLALGVNPFLPLPGCIPGLCMPGFCMPGLCIPGFCIPGLRIPVPLNAGRDAIEAA